MKNYYLHKGEFIKGSLKWIIHAFEWIVLLKQVFAEAKVESLQSINQTLFPSVILFFQKEFLFLCE